MAGTLQRALSKELTEDEDFELNSLPIPIKSNDNSSTEILSLQSPSYTSSQQLSQPNIEHHNTAPSTSPSEQKSEVFNPNNTKKGKDNIDFLRIWIQRENQERDTSEARTVTRKLQTACMMRERWVYTDHNGHFPSCFTKDEDVCLNINIVKNALPKKSNHAFEMKHGVFRVFKLKKLTPKKAPNNSLKSRKSVNTDGDSDAVSDCEEKIEYKYVKADKTLYSVHSFGEFMKDLWFVLELINNGPAKTFCYQRLQTLQAKFKLHMLLNENNEMSESKLVAHRDFYNIRKVDNHVHHSACMTQKHLLRFIKYRLKHCGDDIVYSDNKNKLYSLKQLFAELNLTAYELSIDTLAMHGHRDTFQRFDRFNNKYNPIGQSSLRQVFLKVANYCQGKYLAEITKEVFDDLVDSKYQYSEFRLSIYGKSSTEWDVLAAWVCDNNLHCRNSRWMIQIPRLYAIHKASGLINNFNEMLDNIFRSLFEVTVDPASHPKLHLFLTLVVGFDTVDDESIRENTRHEIYPEPLEWNTVNNPPYIVWSYYIYANLCILNQLRAARGMNTFSYRPHSGEAGDADHVAAAFLLAQSINHGLTLKKLPVLQYLYYLKQVGLSMSPLSNNLLFLEYDRNPFQLFFQRGLNVTLSTDDPLMIHYTKDPLIEEYAIAAQVYKLSAIDMCEIARNSVLQSGFPVSQKKHWLGANFYRRGVAGNDVKQTNVPEIRLLFRDELLAEEENWILGLPPPLFPTINLRKTLRHSLKHSKQGKHVKKHSNYLVAHRTKVPFKLQSPMQSPKQSKLYLYHQNNPTKRLQPAKEAGYDPLGYFARKKHFDDRHIINESEYEKQQQLEQENNSNGAKSLFVAMQNVMKKQFVLVAVGLFVGYIVASMNNNNNNNDRKNEKD